MRMFKPPRTSAGRRALIHRNTEIVALALCPEIQLRLLREGAELWRAEPHIFDDKGPRPFWAFCWASGQAMARHLLDHPETVRGLRVADWGSGSGIAAIAAARAGANTVTAYEIDPLAVEAIRLNARLNGVRVKAQLGDIRSTRQPDWDVLLAADICYYEECYRWLTAVRKQPWAFFLSDPGRRTLDPDRWERLADYRVRTVPEIERYSIVQTSVYRFLPPGNR